MRGSTLFFTFLLIGVWLSAAQCAWATAEHHYKKNEYEYVVVDGRLAPNPRDCPPKPCLA